MGTAVAQGASFLSHHAIVVGATGYAVSSLLTLSRAVPLMLALTLALDGCRPRPLPAGDAPRERTETITSASAPPSGSATVTPPATPPTAGAPCAVVPGPPLLVRSADGTTVAFLELDASRRESTATADAPHAYLCVGRQGAPPKVVLESHEPDPSAGPPDMIAGLGNLVLSPDGSTVYFTTEGWVTSLAAQALDVATGQRHFLFDGVVKEVVAAGPFKGHLVAEHYRLDPDYPVSSPKYRGRMETWSLSTPAGKTVRPLPADEGARRKVLGGR